MKDLKIKRLQFRCPRITQLSRFACEHFSENFKISFLVISLPPLSISRTDSIKQKVGDTDFNCKRGIERTGACFNHVFSVVLRFSAYFGDFWFRLVRDFE